jgi:hypothetical protein
LNKEEKAKAPKKRALSVGPVDFPKEFEERNWSIYRMRVLEKRTLTFIGEQHGLSRERARQIAEKGTRIMRVRQWLREETGKKAEMSMGALRLTTRARNILTNALTEDWGHMTIREFIESFKPDEFLGWPGAGYRSFSQLYNKIRKVDADAADIWTSGHGENYNAAKHGRRRPVVRNISKQDRLSRVHTKSGQ